MASGGHVIQIDDDQHVVPRGDASTHVMETIDYAHHKIHAGSAFSAFVIDSDFDNADVISIAFLTPNTTSWIHMLAEASATTFAQFNILEGPTITDASGTDLVVINRNRNSLNTSGVRNAMALPASNRVRINSTIAADGTLLHPEMIGAGRTGSGSVGATRSTAELILRQNTVYAFRITGNGVGGDNQIASLLLNWYEHTDRN